MKTSKQSVTSAESAGECFTQPTDSNTATQEIVSIYHQVETVDDTVGEVLCTTKTNSVDYEEGNVAKVTKLFLKKA